MSIFSETKHLYLGNRLAYHPYYSVNTMRYLIDEKIRDRHTYLLQNMPFLYRILQAIKCAERHLVYHTVGLGLQTAHIYSDVRNQKALSAYFKSEQIPLYICKNNLMLSLCNTKQFILYYALDNE